MDIEEIFNELSERGYIGYGKFIPTKKLEEYWGSYEPAIHKRGWAWFGKWCSLKEIIERHGYYCTSKFNQPGSLRIRQIHEMPDTAKNKLKSLRKRAQRNSCSIQNAKVEELDDLDRAKLHHVLNLTNIYAHTVKSILHDL